MAKIQYSLVTSATAPFVRMLKFTDGVPSVDATFPAPLDPLALHYATFTPDGAYVAALRVGAPGTTPIRLWKRNPLTGAWSTVASPVLPIALGNAGRIKFVTDTDIVLTDSSAAGSATGAWIGSLDRATDVITWTQIEPSTKQFNAIIPLNAAGTKFVIFRTNPGGSAPYYRSYAKIGGVWTLMTPTNNVPTNSVVRGDFDAVGNVMIGWRTTGQNPIAYFIHFVESANGGVFTNVALSGNSTTGELGKLTGQGTSTNVSACGIPPSGREAFYSHNEAPYLRSVINTGRKTFPNTFAFGNAFNNADLPAVLNGITFLNETTMLVAVNSTLQTRGRVRCYFRSNDHVELVEDPRVSALFDNWSMIPTFIETGPEIATSGASIYDGAIDTFMNKPLTSLKLALLKPTSTLFNKTHVTLVDAIGDGEAYGFGWPQGGIACGAGSFVKGTSGADTHLSLSIPTRDLIDDGSFTFQVGIIYDDSDANKKPLVYFKLPTPQTVKQFDRLQFGAAGNNLITFKAGM